MALRATSLLLGETPASRTALRKAACDFITVCVLLCILCKSCGWLESRPEWRVISLYLFLYRRRCAALLPSQFSFWSKSGELRLAQLYRQLIARLLNLTCASSLVFSSNLACCNSILRSIFRTAPSYRLCFAYPFSQSSCRAPPTDADLSRAELSSFILV